MNEADGGLGARREASIAAGDVTASGGAALVPMVEPAEDRQRDDCCSAFRLVDFSTVGCVLAEGQVGPGLVVVDAIGAEQAPSMSLVEDDDVVEQLSPDGADDAFGEGVLPRRPWRADNLLESESGDGVSDEGVEDAISVAVKEAQGCVKREGVKHLAPCPFRSGMLSDVDVADAATVVIQNYEAVEDPEGGRGDSEEIDSDRSTKVVVEERPPGLRGWASRADRHIPSYGRLAHGES